MFPHSPTRTTGYAGSVFGKYWRQKEGRNIGLNKNELVDITTVAIDAGAPCEKRIADYVRFVRTPYRFRVGDIAVSLKYVDPSVTLQSKIRNMLAH